ncbi:hypothetical protein [Synechococcus sp. CS-197]|uniref:hypothetical protein n=1 Tax=Synechococcus sp. CS-197 TaxID=2847985 RepID=UPI00015258FB|nr:hypothetical protein [Synechococcus sp. CS-197]MCT0250770.1 hypothetical protein [Synechococcus sp. CS-197]CAK22476.1 Conserved hypothetical protein [Synechococcus sp. WH 7803]
MAEGQPLDELRLALMQDVLPMGLAFVDRVRSEGPARVVESLSQGDDPLADLRKEGEPAARVLRERLDQISPGLGNPVMSVQVEVEEPAEPQSSSSLPDDPKELQEVLDRIETRLQRLDALITPGD